MMKALKKKRKGGFTLIELIVVIAILGILAAIAVPRFAGTLNNAREQADNASARTLISAVALAEADGYAAGTAGQPTVDELVKAGYLQSAPVSQQSNADFTINYSGAWVISSITAGGTVTITP